MKIEGVEHNDGKLRWCVYGDHYLWFVRAWVTGTTHKNMMGHRVWKWVLMDYAGGEKEMFTLEERDFEGNTQDMILYGLSSMLSEVKKWDAEYRLDDLLMKTHGTGTT